MGMAKCILSTLPIMLWTALMLYKEEKHHIVKHSSPPEYPYLPSLDKDQIHALQ